MHLIVCAWRINSMFSAIMTLTIMMLQALEAAGCFAIVLECVPAPIAAAATQAIGIPTIGIGAGPACSGQVLVFHDLLGMLSHPHHAQVRVLPCFGKFSTHLARMMWKTCLDPDCLSSAPRVSCQRPETEFRVLHDAYNGSTAAPDQARCPQVTPKFCKQYAQVGHAINEGLHAFQAEVVSGEYPSKATSPYKITSEELDAFMTGLEREGLGGSASAAAAAAPYAGLS